MIELAQGDILRSEADAIVNTVNCVGVMGRGIALQFKKAFPDNFKAYKSVCDHKQLQPGRMFVYDLGRLHNPRYVINFPTKRHWRGKSKIEDIKEGLATLVREIQDRKIQSIAIPPLGCGLGGLDWAQVRTMIESVFANLPETHVYLYEPKGAPAPELMVNRTKRPNMTAGRAALLGLMRRYLDGLMDVAVSLLELHKLMYFMQEAGEPLKLDYVEGRYGPYATNLGHVLSHIEGHFTTGYGDGEDDPFKQIEYKPDAINEAEKYLQGHSSTQKHFDRVVSLIDGFETPYGMELLATVHWVATRQNASTVKDAIAGVHRWNLRKKNIQDKHIRIAWNTLEAHGWLEDAAAKTRENTESTFHTPTSGDINR